MTQETETEAKLDELPSAEDVETLIQELDVEDYEEHSDKIELHYNLENSDAAIIETFTFIPDDDGYRIFHEFMAFAESAELVEEQKIELNEDVDDVVVRDDDATPRNFVESWRMNADLEAVWEPVTKGF